jgi:hypothetical protein
MANKKISDLPAAGAAALTDTYETLQGGVSKQETLAQLQAALNAFLKTANNLSDLSNAATARANLAVIEILKTGGVLIFDVPNDTINDLPGLISINADQRFLMDATGVTQSLNWTDRQLIDSAGNLAFDWNTGLPSKSSASVYASGAAYTLTNAQALVHFGTTDPTLTIGDVGTYLLIANSNLIYNAATYAATQTATLKLRNTTAAADVPNALRAIDLRVITTVTDNAGVIVIPPAIVALNAGDSISIFGAVSAAPAAGSVQVNSAEIIAVRLY